MYLDYDSQEPVSFESLQGKTLTAIIVDRESHSNTITFITTEGEKFIMYHEQDCCEDVTIDDIVGDIEDMLNNPIEMADVSSKEGERKEEYDDSSTWTFYRLATIKGYLDIKWYGTSNGYYSESVSFVKVKN